MANEKVDAVIVGAGASGSVFAAVLARAGKKVVLLETGPDWQLTDLVSSDFWGRRIKAAGAPFLLEGKNAFGYSYQSGWGVGGAALHYFANLPRLLPNDFKMKSEHGRGLDWPITYQDLAPWYDRVAQEIGVSGDAKAEEIWRPAGKPYPMPPMKTFKNGQVWLKGFESVGIRMAFPRMVVIAVRRRGRARQRDNLPSCRSSLRNAACGTQHGARDFSAEAATLRVRKSRERPSVSQPVG